MSVLDMLQKDIVDKLAIAEEMYVILCDLEWSYVREDGGLLCPVCKGRSDLGHKDGCGLDYVLAVANKKGYDYDVD